jgi:CheY-like chemotaxis protein
MTHEWQDRQASAECQTDSPKERPPDPGEGDTRPAVEPDPAVDGASMAAQWSAASKSDRSPAGPDVDTLLLAEDNLVNQKLVAAILGKAGYRTVIVGDGKAAVDAYVSAPDRFSLILMDIQMPELDGVAATRAIRQWEANHHQSQNPGGAADRHIRIVAVTAGAVHDEKNMYSQAGMDDFLSKPIRRGVLLRMVEKWLKKKKK